jgi:hypothetical protein
MSFAQNLWKCAELIARFYRPKPAIGKKTAVRRTRISGKTSLSICLHHHSAAALDAGTLLALN